jgi:hypothetical protein
MKLRLGRFIGCGASATLAASLVLASCGGPARLAGSSANSSAAIAAADAVCGPTLADFNAAAGDFAPQSDAAAYRKTLPSEPAQAARKLLADASAEAGALDHLSDLYAAILACRGAGGAVPSGLGPARVKAGEIVDRAAAMAAIYQAESARILTLSGESDAQLAQAPMPGPAFRALNATPIYAAPDTGGARVSLLRKGQRVTEPPTEAPQAQVPVLAAAWTAIALNDGSTGYVASAALRRVTANFSPRLAVSTDPAIAAADYLRGPFAASENRFEAQARPEGRPPSFDPAAAALADTANP